MIQYDLDIATQGLLSNNPIQIYAQGLLRVEIQDIPIIINSGHLPQVTNIGLIKKNFKRIKVILNYKGKEYTTYAYIKNHKISAKDIKISVNYSNDIPKINIKIIGVKLN